MRSVSSSRQRRQGGSKLSSVKTPRFYNGRGCTRRSARLLSRDIPMVVFACCMIAIGASLLLSGLIGIAFHRNALHSVARL